MTKRGKATLLSALAFVAGLAIYFAVRDHEPTPGRSKATAEEEAADKGRSLRQRLGGLLQPSRPKAEGASETPTHSAGPVCEKCTTENCAAGTDDGCDSIADAADRKACEDAYACFATNNCVVQGDPIPCWCGKNMTTCVTDNSGPTQANGPCVKQVFAAAKTTDADTIFKQLLNPELPIGRAVRLTSCRGSYCPGDCKLPIP